MTPDHSLPDSTEHESTVLKMNGTTCSLSISLIELTVNLFFLSVLMLTVTVIIDIIYYNNYSQLTAFL